MLPNGMHSVFWTLKARHEGKSFYGCTLSDHRRKVFYRIILNSIIGKNQFLFNVIVHEIVHAVMSMKGVSSVTHNYLFTQECCTLVDSIKLVEDVLWSKLHYKVDIEKESVISGTDAYINHGNFHVIVFD
jgi:hypothetical protein